MTNDAGEFGPSPRIFTIDSGRPFLSDLARGLMALAAGDPIALSEIQLFLPNRRAARALGEAFLEINDGRATLLPRILPLGEADEAAEILALGADAEAPLPDAIGKLERRLALSRFVAAAREKSFDGQENWTAALKGADALTDFLDSLYAEEADARGLTTLAPDGFAAHWRRSLDFLKIVTEVWPRYLDSRDLDDPKRRQTRIVSRQAETLAALAAGRPVVIAGTTGSMPAVRRLIKGAAALPSGYVVLPGLDRALARDARAWTAIDDAHPQSGLKLLIESLGVAPDAVRLWPHTAEASAPRARLLSVALRPAEATDDWRRRLIEATDSDPGAARAIDGLSLIEAADEEDEAAGIAIAFRETLETARDTAILVTPDRNLARRVAAKMRRWNVEIYDSGGTPFANAAHGTFLRLAAAAFAAPDDAAAALALLRHPLTGLGLSPADRARCISSFDRAARGLGPNAETGGLAGKIQRADSHGAAIALAAIEAPDIFQQAEPAPLAALIAAHAACAERIAATDRDAGADRLWRGDEGAAAAEILSDIRAAADALGLVSPRDYPDLFSELISAEVVRGRTGAHPRLEILGPLEARLLSADLVILGGLNEGVWPGDGGADPFLSRVMRKGLGLPSPERAIGLSAHDFAQGAAAPRVLLTRSKRRSGAPAKPSRWIVRLKNILEKAGALPAIDKSLRYRRAAEGLDVAGPAQPVRPPAPRPPIATRPRALPVTQIETFLRDPYAIYARHILKLKPLDPVGEPFGPRFLGSLLHATFEAFVRGGINPERPDAEQALRAEFDRLAPEFGLVGADRALWAPSIENSVRVFVSEERMRRRNGVPAQVEEAGETVLQAAGGPFTLSARADRIDILNDHRALLIDYKTSPPSKKEMLLFRVQLPLTAMIVERGGFPTLGKRDVAAFAYLQALTRKTEASEAGMAGDEARAAIDEAVAGVGKWIDAFDRPDQPYLSQPRPKFVKERGDYDLLARRREWALRDES